MQKFTPWQHETPEDEKGLFIETADLRNFLDAYWAHPIWERITGDSDQKITAAGSLEGDRSGEQRESREEPWIRLSFLPSDFLLQRRARQGKFSEATSRGTIVRRFVRRDFNPGGIGIELVNKANRTGWHVYYYANVTPFELNHEHVRASDVTNILWIPVDHDRELPCGILKLYEEAGILPWIVCETSQIGLSFKKYQVLIAVAVEDSRKFDELRALVRQTAEVFGADPAISDRGRLMRLPGTRNWKGAEQGRNRGYCRLIVAAGVVDPRNEIEKEFRATSLERR